MGKYIANKNPLQHTSHSAQHNIIFVGVCCSEPKDTVKGMTYCNLSLIKVSWTGIVTLPPESS
jgi:DNA polymerase III epsilon subunit-like protein